MPAQFAEARKVVTIVFTDVVGSTVLGERLDPETLRHVLSRYFEVARAALQRHGGTVEKFIGDAVMAVFGIPTLHEDDALRAVRAAIEMRRDLEDLNDELQSEHGVRIETRTGVNTGEVVSSDDAGEQKLATGDAINVAARLEQAAHTGEILMGQETHRLVRGAVLAERLAPIAVKGKSEPLPAWRVRDLLAEGPAATSGPFVGRQPEITELREALARAARDRLCALVTIVGPPGIGKTRLARELAGVVGDAQIVFGRCLAYGEGVAHAPLAEIVRQITADLPRLLAAEEDAGVIEPRIAAAVGRSEVPASPEEIGWAFRRLFEAAGRERPLVVVLDDIQWADQLLLDMLEYILGFSSGSAVLLVCLARPDLFDLRPSWATPGSNKTLVALEPLTDEDSRSLIAHLEGQRRLGDDMCAQIVAAAEGYPLFVEQMLALHADDPHQEIAVPPSIHALLAARIDRLVPGERDVLTRASVEGRLFHRRAVAELLPADARGGVGTHLLSLVRKEFLRPDRALFRGDDGFRFSHVLIRDVAYNSTPKHLRAELHEHYGRWLEQQLDGHSGGYVEIVGFHLEQAWRYRAELGLASDALAYEAGARLWAAARDALRRMEIPSAVGLYRRAVALLPEEPTGDLLREFAATLNRTADRAPALPVVEQAIERSRAAGNRSGELRARLDRLWMPQGTGLRDAAAIRRQVEEVIPQLEELGDDAGLTNAWQLVAMSERNAGHHGAANRAMQRALDHARAIPDRLEESEVRSFMIESVRDGSIPAAAAIEWCENELRDRRGDWLVEMSVRACTAVLHAMCGSFDVARDHIARSTALSAEFEVWTGRLPVYDLACIEMLAGDYRAAERALRDGDELNADYEEWWGMGFYTRASIAATLCAQLRFEEAADLTEAMPGEPGDWVVPQTICRTARAQALARLGRPAEAVELARQAVTRSEPTDDLNLRGDALVAQADVLEACGRHADAGRSLDAAVALYSRKGNLVMCERARALAGAIGRTRRSVR